MSVKIGLRVAALAASLCGCAHLERPSLRMARPAAEPAALAAYAAPSQAYPTVGGDILRGTAPAESAAYQATTDAPGTAPSLAPPPLRPIAP
jgi:hypothetical protein